ncbi:hypothetical protein [Brevundimonas mediterranea]|uniref:hypothetical protein n=1 Tax=Brevundimonas mediterranea TaxID=74329 RepID=UPI0040332A17
MVLTDAPDSEADTSPAWTVLVANSACGELSAMARNEGISLPQYVADLVSMRAAVELVAPSPTWLAIPIDVAAIQFTPSPELAERIEALSQITGQHHDVIVSNLASGGPPMPPPQLPLGYLRTDPGRGRIFGMYFEIAGFQYSLMRHLGGDAFRNSQALDAAFLALASQAASTGKFMNESISEAAQQFATKVVMIANRRSVSPRDVTMAGRSKATTGRRASTASETEGVSKADQNSVPRRASSQPAHQPRGGDPFAAFSEWHEDIDTEAYKNL